MTLPGLVTEAVVIRAVPSEIYALVPTAVAGAFAVFLDITESKKFAACVVKYSVHNNLDSGFVAKLCEMSESLIGADPAIDEFVVSGVVAMGGGLKERSDVKGCAP